MLQRGFMGVKTLFKSFYMLLSAPCRTCCPTMISDTWTIPSVLLVNAWLSVMSQKVVFGLAKDNLSGGKR